MLTHGVATLKIPKPERSRRGDSVTMLLAGEGGFLGELQIAPRVHGRWPTSLGGSAARDAVPLQGLEVLANHDR